MNNKIISLLTILVLSSSSFLVIAACGDSKCAFENGEFKCIAETPQGPKVCTEANPCNINCS